MCKDSFWLVGQTVFPSSPHVHGYFSKHLLHLFIPVNAKLSCDVVYRKYSIFHVYTDKQ